MAADNHVFVAWEERVISQEKGHRVVHYYLKGFSGESILAVVGTERSIRHITYVVSEDYLDAFGHTRTINSGTKWRTRREVVEWLTFLVSKRRQSSPISNTLTSETRNSLMAGLPNRGIHIADEGLLPRKLKARNSNILWSGTAWTCSQQLKHYPSFCRNGTKIAINSFAKVMAEEENHYLGYLEDLYENKGQKKVKVQWFHHIQKVRCVIPQLEGHPREVFITSHVQVINAECIDGPAAVLTPRDYEKYISLVPKSSSSGVYMCFREFRHNKVMPVSLSKLDGYYNQTIFTVLRSQHVSQHKSKGHKLHEVKHITHEDPLERGPRRSTSVKECPKLESSHSGIRKSIPGNQIAKAEPTCQKLKIKLSSRGLVGIQLVRPKVQCKLSFEVGDNIEFLCQDSGMRGCWFRCKVLQVLHKRLKVQYDDIQDCDGPGKLEEWVPSSRVADSDKLGMRCTGRFTVRPQPPEDSSDLSFEVGAAVDAWWCDGWWEGVVAGFDVCGSGHLQVYFPGENRLLEFQMKNVRASRDWIDNKWIEVKRKTDIKSFISSSLTEVSKCSIKVESTSKHTMEKQDSNVAPKLKRRWRNDYLEGKKN
ncbi:uncharacterized protein LOC107766548 [Nicotiana tabacum]|uniref:Uncharacterized protein LOC107766548 n=1 Tax=Nicotiana tabacum TaxID=4097 RepID=A0AC58S6U0_TOBAC